MSDDRSFVGEGIWVGLCLLLLLVLAGAGASWYFQFQRARAAAEAEIVMRRRSKLPKRLTVTPDERRRLVRAGRGLGTAIKGLISIVSPGTFLRWVNGANETKRSPARKPGRPRTPDQIRELVVKIAG